MHTLAVRRADHRVAASWITRLLAPARTALLAALLALCAGPLAADEPKLALDPRPFEEILAEGDALADKRDYTNALIQYKNAYEKWVSDVRGLPFKESVRPKLMDRVALQKEMIRLVNEEITDEEFHLMQQTLIAFGMAPVGLNAKQTTIDLHTEEVAGFYNPKNKDMVLVKEPDQRKKGLLGALFGGGDGFDKAEQKTTLSHEMVHALQDQQFDLNAMDRAVSDDDDMALAFSALVEGDATVVMLADMQRGEEDPHEIIRTPPEMADVMFGAMKALSPFASGKTMKNAPAIFRESLMFPYHRGTVFVLHQTNHGGWKAVDAVFRDPPTSTEQILHPEKYKNRDEPMRLEFPDLKPAVGEQWKYLGTNVIGEFQTIVMLREQRDAEKAAAGWDGDVYHIYETPEKRTGLVWSTTWDTAGDAREFYTTYKTLAAKKAGDSAAPVESSRSRTVLKLDESLYQVEVRGKDVVVVEGFSEDETRQLVDLAFDVKKTVKKFDRNRPEKKKAGADKPAADQPEKPAESK